MELTVPFVLASQSPRRRRLLEQIGLAFIVHPSPVEEIIPPGLEPGAVAAHLAALKARDIAPRYPDALTLGADTIVVVEGDILGKPTDADEACAMLMRLQGRSHIVYTGIALLHPATDREETRYEATEVTFGPMTHAEIQRYVATGAPLDKAGAYGIQDDQGALYVAAIHGDYYNVVGLPLHRMYQCIRAKFTDLLA